MEAQQFYNAVSRTGIRYGPHFRTVCRTNIAPDTAAQLRCAPCLPRHHSRSRWAPARLSVQTDTQSPVGSPLSALSLSGVAIYYSTLFAIGPEASCRPNTLVLPQASARCLPPTRRWISTSSGVTHGMLQVIGYGPLNLSKSPARTVGQLLQPAAGRQAAHHLLSCHGQWPPLAAHSGLDRSSSV